MKKVIIIMTFVLSVAINTTTFSAEVKTLAETTTTWDGTKLPKLDTDKTKITITHITIKAGEKLAFHKHPVITIAYILEGTLTVKTDKGKVLTAPEGEAFAEVVNQWHYGENNGKKDVVLVVAYVGDESQPLSINKK